MENIQPDGRSQPINIVVEAVENPSAEMVQTLIEVDLQTFMEPTFSPYTALALLKNGQVYLLRVDGRVIGTCVCVKSWGAAHEALLLSMGIRPGWRGRGLGQRFVHGVLHDLQGRGLDAVRLLVGKTNFRAIRTYQDVGFAAVGEYVASPQWGGNLLELRMPLNALSDESRSE